MENSIDVVLSVFIQPCTKRRRAQFSICAELTWLSVCVHFRCVCVCFRCVCARASDVCACACASDVRVRASDVCAENFSHSPRLLLQKSRAFNMLALCGI